MTETNDWWLIQRATVDHIRKVLDQIIESSDNRVKFAEDAMMNLDSGLHLSNVKPWDK